MAAERGGGQGSRRLFKPNRHDHDLLEVEGLVPYTCTGCKEKGVNFGYQCSTPSCLSGKVSIFHVDCATLEDEKQHPIQTHLKFRFRKNVKFTLHHRCTACRHELKGFVYKTEDMWLHPLCLVLPPELQYNGQSYTLCMQEGDPYKCCFCNNINKHGWKYRCGDLCMDVGCAKYYLHGLSARGILSSPVHRKRDKFKDTVQSLERYVGVAGGLASVVDCFHGFQRG